MSSGIPASVSAPIPFVRVFLEDWFSFFSPKMVEMEEMPVFMEDNWSADETSLLISCVASLA